MGRIITLLVTLVIGIVVLTACEGNVTSLKVGDCYNGPPLYSDKVTEVVDVDIVSCDDPHESEVYAKFDLPDSSWKGDDYVWEQAERGCTARFEAFIGIEYDLSTWYADIFYPLEDGWKERGDRTVTCSVIEETQVKVSGSARNSRR